MSYFELHNMELAIYLNLETYACIYFHLPSFTWKHAGDYNIQHAPTSYLICDTRKMKWKCYDLF
jgi:hypothetical protein